MNLLNGTHLDLLTSAGLPLFWTRTSADNTGGNGLFIVNTTGPFGDTEDVFQAVRVSEGDGPMWEQYFGLIDPADNVFFTRDRPFPGLASFPATLRCSVWTKGTDIVNSQESLPLGAIWVTYYWDTDGNILMASGEPGADGKYHFKPGPGGIDQGTWDWTFVTYDMPIYSNTEIVQMRHSIGLHDPTNTGELLFSRPKVELIA